MQSQTKSFFAFNSTLDSLAPDAELLFSLAQGWVIFGDDADQKVTPSQFTITAKYQYSDKTVSENNRIDLRPYASSEGAKDPVVEELENIRKAIEKSTK